MTEPLKNLPYRLRYRDGRVSRGGYKTFEAAVKGFKDCKENYANLYSDLKDVVCIEERQRDYLQL